MKKLYTTPKYKERAERLRRSQYRRLQKSQRAHIAAVSPPQIENRPRYLSEDQSYLPVPSNFSIVGNPEEMFKFFTTVYHEVENGRSIFLDMSSITVLSADAILYMLSRFEYFERIRNFRSIGGNLPIDGPCRDLIVASGFLKHMKVRTDLASAKTDILSIESDHLVQPLIANRVVSYAQERMASSRGETSKGVYATIIECMANTHNHAYDPADLHTKWWLMALHEIKTKRVHFAFLDNGEGIPATVKMKFKEKIAQVLTTPTDHGALIRSALDGEFRTRTKQIERGKGLPKINSFSRDGRFENLKIVSGHGYVDVAGRTAVHLNKKFYGTLLSWDFV